MAEHIIVGAGLGGLYTACQLINKGVLPSNIVIIDPRAGIYTRPGHLNCDLFGAIANTLGINTLHSEAHHIKELERILYSALKFEGVRFIKEQFVGIQLQTEGLEKAILTQSDEGIASVYPADFVFDCTGKPAEVAQAVNRQLESQGLSKAFNRDALCENSPISDHLIAHIKVENYEVLNDFCCAEIQTVPDFIKEKPIDQQLVLRERLVAMGWINEAFPTFYIFPQGSKNKLCLYMETPESLPKEQQSDWINLLLSIYSNGAISSFTELKPSNKYGTKPRIVGFKNELYVSDKVVYSASDCPTVVSLFDALKGFDYRLANGVSSGIECCNFMISSLTIRGGRITAINSTRCEDEIFAFLHGNYKTRLTEINKARADSIVNAAAYFSELYEQTLSDITGDDEKKAQYKKTAAELAYKALTLKEASPLVENINEYTYLNELNERLILLLRVRDYLTEQETNEHFVAPRILELTGRLKTAVLGFHQISHTSASTNALKLFTSLQITLKRLRNSELSHELSDKIEQVIRELDILATSFSIHKRGLSTLYNGTKSNSKCRVTITLSNLGLFCLNSLQRVPRQTAYEPQGVLSFVPLLDVDPSDDWASDEELDTDYLSRFTGEM